MTKASLPGQPPGLDGVPITPISASIAPADGTALPPREGRAASAGSSQTGPGGGVDARTAIADYVTGLKAVLDSLSIADVFGFIGHLRESYEQGAQTFVVGNGGSAATASHLACDLGKTVLGKAPTIQTRRFRVIALTDNMPLLTAWGNDVGYETVFAEQLRNLANPGDLLVAITGSGNSPNVLEAVRAARELGLKSVGLLGFDGGAVKGLLDQCIVIDSDNYGYIEDAHMMLTHLVTSYFKEVLRRPAEMLREQVPERIPPRLLEVVAANDD